MNGQGCEQIAVVAREWNAARRLALSLRADRNGLECERDNTNPCWRQYVQTGPFERTAGELPDGLAEALVGGDGLVKESHEHWRRW